MFWDRRDSSIVLSSSFGEILPDQTLIKQKKMTKNKKDKNSLEYYNNKNVWWVIYVHI